MGNRLLIGVGLGLVAAVVFASATTGPLVARFLLFFITPLPIALAGLGWGWRTATVAGLGGTLLVAIGAGATVALVFALSQVAPMVALTHLALLNRTGPAGGETIEWYPAGRLVIWGAAMAGLLALASLLLIGGDLEVLRKELGEFIQKTLESSLPQLPNATPLSETEIKSLADVALWLLPAASAISWMASLMFNLWLAGRVTLASGQLARPWPDLAAIDYPPGTALAFGASLLALLTLDGYARLAASGFAGAFFLAFMLLGLAIVHYTTRGATWRPFALWALYAALLFLNMWIGVLAAILGLSESIVGLRQRYPPPAAPRT
jgi:hypothetical protein